MKTLCYFLATSLLLFFSACSHNDSSIVAPYERTGNSGRVVERAIITPETPLPFMTNFDKARIAANNSNTGSRSARTASSGPYTTAGNLTLYLHNYKVILGSNQSIYAAGQYICDIYIDQLDVVPPAGQSAVLQGVSKFGYINFSTQTIGVQNTQTFTPSGSTYSFYTYSIVPLTDMSGRGIYNGTLPTDLTGLTFTYSFQ